MFENGASDMSCSATKTPEYQTYTVSKNFQPNRREGLGSHEILFRRVNFLRGLRRLRELIQATLCLRTKVVWLQIPKNEYG